MALALQLMKPLFVLIAGFFISMAVQKITSGQVDYSLCARIAMSAMLLFTSLAHFLFTKGMAMMIPAFMPYKTQFVYFTGVIEIAAATGLLIHSLIELTGWLLIIFFLLLLPANIYAASKHINYEKASYNGKGFGYLWFRVPLQLAFILWTYLSAIHSR